jgi:hypothetical protein
MAGLNPQAQAAFHPPSVCLHLQGGLVKSADALRAAYQKLWEQPAWLDSIDKPISNKQLYTRKLLFKQHVLSQAADQR